MGARRETVAAGLAVMEDGGNAVDAAVAMGFVAAVVEPWEASVGGSGFLLLHDRGRGGAWSVEFPPRAPQLAVPDGFELTEEPVSRRLLGTASVRGDANATGYRAPCVPAVVAGLTAARERFGSFPLARLLEPAIALARDGFEPDEAFSLHALAELRALRANPGARAVFLEDGLPRTGRLRQPDLARTLELLAGEGVASFYRGQVARAVEEEFTRRGGWLRGADLEAYRPSIERPLIRRCGDYVVATTRSPSGGWTVLEALLILAARRGEEAPGSPGELHAVAQALQLAFADRYRYAGDPDWADVPLAGMLSPSYADELADAISAGPLNPVLRSIPAAPWDGLRRRALHDPWPHQPVLGHGTTHLCAVDRDARVACCTITAGNSFGSKVVAEGTGVLFDSGMAWFHPEPGLPNSIAPGKRPLVNMAPVLVLRDGRPVLAVGAAGGRRIISAVTQVVRSAVDLGLPVDAALAAPRLDASDRPLLVSERVPRPGRDALVQWGHEVRVVDEDHAPHSYELARPSAIAIDADGVRRGAIHPFARGYVAAS